MTVVANVVCKTCYNAFVGGDKTSTAVVLSYSPTLVKEIFGNVAIQGFNVYGTCGFGNVVESVVGNQDFIPYLGNVATKIDACQIVTLVESGGTDLFYGIGNINA